MKKFLFQVLAACMAVLLSGCIAGGAFAFMVLIDDDSAKKEEVFAFVCEQEAALLAAIEAGDFSAFEDQGFIKSISPREDHVDFSCGGAGIGSGTSYVGFYYTPNHDKTAVWCAPQAADALSPSGDGFFWQEPNGDNRYYTEHICGNFYYYEASF